MYGLDFLINGCMRYFLVGIITIMLIACEHNPPVKQEIIVDGFAQGTTYKVRYLSLDGVNHQRAIDSLLIEIDNSMSTYNKNSIISDWNNNNSGAEIFIDRNFENVFKISLKVEKETSGLFDPTVAPLVNTWGFGFEKANEMDSSIIDTILLDVGMHQLSLSDGTANFILKSNPDCKLDFNAVAQGYTVDVLGELLEARGITNYLVEVGGELKAKGTNMQDTLWRIGIDRPLPNLAAREIEAIVNLDNKALATSGNYRKFYERDGKKYSHTINPKTGYPVEHNLLSATVVTKECAYADAYATAFMVMGLDKSKEFLVEHKELEALLIYGDETGGLQTFITDGLKEFIELNPDKK